MKKELAIATMIALYSSTHTDADLRDRIAKAKDGASQRISEQRERAKSFRDATRSRVQDSADRARNSFDEARERTEDYYHERLEGKVEEERRRFKEDPKGYSIDLGRRINNGIIEFEDVASDGIAQGLVDIDCGGGKRLGDIIEVKFGIKEDTTKRGVKVGVLYLMGYNPAYFVNELPIVKNAEGRMLTIADVRDNSGFRQNGRNLERYLMETSDSYRRGDLSAAKQSLTTFRRELENLAEIYEINREREARGREVNLKNARVAQGERLRYQKSGLERYLRGVGERLNSGEIDSLPAWATEVSPTLFQIISDVNGNAGALLQSQFSTSEESTTINAIGCLIAYTPELMTRLRIVTNIFEESISIEEARDIPELRGKADRIREFLSDPYKYAFIRWDSEKELELFGDNLRGLTAEYSALRYRSRGGDMDFPEWTPQVVVDNIMLEEMRLRGIRSDFSGLDYLDAIGFGISNALSGD